MNTQHFFQRFWQFMISVGYARAAYELQQLSDHQLELAGLSRQKLAQGAAGFPWTVESAAQGTQAKNILHLHQPAANKSPVLDSGLRLAA